MPCLPIFAMFLLWILVDGWQFLWPGMWGRLSPSHRRSMHVSDYLGICASLSWFHTDSWLVFLVGVAEPSCSATNLGDVHCSCWHHGISEFLQSLDCVSLAYCGNLEWHIWVLGDVSDADKNMLGLLTELSRPAEICRPFCQVLDIWEKGQGWTVQPHDRAVCYCFPPLGFFGEQRIQQASTDFAMNGCMNSRNKKHPNPGRRRRWCILGWRLEVLGSHISCSFQWPSARYMAIVCNSFFEGIGATPTGYHGDTLHAGSLWCLGQSLRSHSRCKTTTTTTTPTTATATATATPTTTTTTTPTTPTATATATEVQITNIWFVQQLCSELQIACFFISNSAGHALEIIGGIRSHLSIESGIGGLVNNSMSWPSRVIGLRGMKHKLMITRLYFSLMTWVIQNIIQNRSE